GDLDLGGAGRLRLGLAQRGPPGEPDPEGDQPGQCVERTHRAPPGSPDPRTRSLAKPAGLYPDAGTTVKGSRREWAGRLESAAGARLRWGTHPRPPHEPAG